jgi:hypothetical protein
MVGSFWGASQETNVGEDLGLSRALDVFGGGTLGGALGLVSGVVKGSTVSMFSVREKIQMLKTPVRNNRSNWIDYGHNFFDGNGPLLLH